MPNRTAKLMLQTAYCSLSVIAFAASLGLFKAEYVMNWYVYFTNLSNYFCMGLMAAELVQTVRSKGDGYVTVSPLLKFTGTVMIIITALVFNLMIAPAPDRDPKMNFEVASILMHIVLPTLFVADWLLFYRHRQMKWYAPLPAMLVVLAYEVWIQIRALLLPVDSPLLRYPYSFVNTAVLGWGGMVRWAVILMSAFVAGGYVLMAVEYLPFWKKGE